MKLKRRPDAEADTAGAARADARSLALELAGLTLSMSVDKQALGVVLRPHETVRRVTSAWLRVLIDGGWSDASHSQVMVTDRRLILRLADGELASLWWGAVHGFEVDLDAGHVVLDFGDGRPRLLSGGAAPLLAVAGVANLYGVQALATHPCLTPIRDE